MPGTSPLILAIGDSVIAGYGLPATESFPAQLERRLATSRPEVRVVNAGVSGDTTADALRRMLRVLSRLKGRPDLAIVQLGPNDVLRQLPPSSTRSNLDALLVELERCGIPVLLTTVPAPSFMLLRAGDYVGIHEELARRHGAATLPFFPPGVLGHRDMVLGDRIHPNGRAITAVVDAMLPEIERLLTESRSVT